MDAAHVATDLSPSSTLLLSWIQQAVLLGTALAAFTCLVVRFAPRRLRPGLETLLWSIVLIKFLIPIGPASSFSLASAIANAWAGSTVAESPIDDARPDRRAVPFLSTLSTETATETVTSTALAVPSNKTNLVHAAREPIRWRSVLGAGYLAGLLALFAWRLATYRSLVRRCRAMPSADPPTRRLVVRICRQLGVRRIPQVRVSDQRSAPFVMGLFSPVLILAHHHLAVRDELETVVVHEVAHLRRGDMLVRYLQWTTGTVFFFWPVVAWVNRRIDAVCEQACDEWALRLGKLTAGEYALCLVQAMRPVRSGRLAYHPCGMAGHPSSIERRIEMIFEAPRRTMERRSWGLLAVAFSLVWAVFALSGGREATGSQPGDVRSATDESVKEHAIELYHRVAAHEAADFTGDGAVSYAEKSAYLIAVAMRNSEAFMEEFPYADRNHSDRLDVLEVFGAIRAVTLIAYADRRDSAGTDSMDLEFFHDALDVQSWLLDHAVGEPTRDELDNLWSIVVRVRNPRGCSARMLDHGAPGDGARKKWPPDNYPRFAELENNISTIRAKLAVERDAERTATLTRMLEKLEALLTKLQES